jgi:hypothetical protein
MWGWLKSIFGPGRERTPQSPFPPGDPRREVWQALREYERRNPEARKRGLTPDRTPLVLKESEPLEKAAYEVAREYLDLAKTEENKTYAVKPTEANPEFVAKWAEKAVRRHMKKQGTREREHYYGAAERKEVGEIDRTYELPAGKSSKTPRRKR